MPDPVGYFDDDSYNDFLLPWKRRFQNVPGEVIKASALTEEEKNEVLERSGFNALRPFRR